MDNRVITEREEGIKNSPPCGTQDDLIQNRNEIHVEDNENMEAAPVTDDNENVSLGEVPEETLKEEVTDQEEMKRKLEHTESTESSEDSSAKMNIEESTAESDKIDLNCSKSGTAPDTPDSPSSIYQVKWVGWGKKHCPVITQNENGPCPLISIMNVLLLRGKLSLPEGCQVISAGQLLEYLGDLLVELTPRNSETQLDFQHNINDAIAVLPKLQTGLDVNVRFTGVNDFEYTEECLIFDLLNISLYHGWLVDPQTKEVAVAVHGLSYNQLVETIIRDRSSADSLAVSRALVAEQWLDESQSQLTYHGLCELNSSLKDGELAVFFRNNHFSTVYKTKEELFLLVTDQGFLDQTKVVWETLGNIEGDTEFVDHEFQSVQLENQATIPTNHLTGEHSLDKDHALAVALGKEEEAGREREKEWEQFKDQLGSSEGLTDEQLATRLQEAENQAAAEEARQEEAVQSQAGPSNPIGPRGGPGKKDKNCNIL